MRKIWTALALAGLLAGCDEASMAALQGGEAAQQQASEVARWETAVASVDCRLVTEGQYLPVELQSGLSRERVQQILAQKVNRKQAVPLQGGGYAYIAGPCTPAPAAPAAAPAAPAAPAA